MQQIFIKLHFVICAKHVDLLYLAKLKKNWTRRASETAKIAHSLANSLLQTCTCSSKSVLFLRLVEKKPFAILGKRSLVPTEMPRKMRTFLKDEHHTANFKALIWNDLIHNFFEYISLSQRLEYMKIIQIYLFTLKRKTVCGRHEHPGDHALITFKGIRKYHIVQNRKRNDLQKLTH